VIGLGLEGETGSQATADLGEGDQNLISITREMSDFDNLIRTEDFTGTMKMIEQKWSQAAPNIPFTYSFLDQDLDQLYQSERRLGNIIGIFSGLGIFIACLGLLGLAIFITERRTKEIGIRKVLGASVASILLLLSKDFTKLILIAFAISIPLTFYMARTWLQDYAYRITLGVDTFVWVGVAVMSIAWITISFQSVKAALANPVKSLRSE